MKKNQKNIRSNMKQKADALIKKSKKMNLIKNLAFAFDTTPCEKEIHKGGKKDYFIEGSDGNVKKV